MKKKRKKRKVGKKRKVILKKKKEKINKKKKKKGKVGKKIKKCKKKSEKKEECNVDYYCNPKCNWMWGNTDFSTLFSCMYNKKKTLQFLKHFYFFIVDYMFLKISSTS